MKKNIAHSSLFILVSLSAYLLIFFVYGDIKLKNLSFAGEEIPKNHYSEIEQLIVANNKKIFKRLYIKGKSLEYMSGISQKLKENNMPIDLKFIPIVESSLNVKALSEDNAAGLWQLIPNIASQYGARVGTEGDERYDISISTTIALEYLNYLYNQESSWIAASIAYNIGEGELDRIRNGNKEYDLFSEEINQLSGNYIFKALAYKYGK